MGEVQSPDFEGFFSDRSRGNALEVVSVWQGVIFDVEHVAAEGPIPPSLPERLFGPVFRQALQEPVTLTDPRTQITYYVRRVGAPADPTEPEPFDWSVPASAALVLMTVAGIVAVWMLVRMASAPASGPEAQAALGRTTDASVTRHVQEDRGTHTQTSSQERFELPPGYRWALPQPPGFTRPVPAPRIP